MSIVPLNVKIDPEVKQRLKELASEVGVPVSHLVNGLIKQAIRDRTVVFDLNPTPFEASERLGDLGVERYYNPK